MQRVLATWVIRSKKDGLGFPDRSFPLVVLPLMTVDNSHVAPTRLTAHPTLLMISKLFLPHLSNSEDCYGPLWVRVPARG